MDLMDDFRSVEKASANRYWVRLQFTDKLTGGQPASKKLFEAWQASKNTPAETVARQAAQIPDLGLEEKQEAITSVFMRDERGPYIGDYQVKAMLKEVIVSLGMTLANRGSKQTMQHLLHVEAGTPDGRALSDLIERGEADPAQLGRLYLYDRDDKILPDSDIFEEKTGTTQTPQGERTFIKRMQVVHQPCVYVVIRLPAGIHEARSSAIIDEKMLLTILAHGQNDALGAARSQGSGRFLVRAIRRLDENALMLPKRGGGGAKKADEDAPEEGGDHAADPDPVLRRKPGRPKKTA